MIDLDSEDIEQLQQWNELEYFRRKELPEYNVWKDMKYRCYNPDHDSYRYYGGRGIKVYREWQNDFWAWFRYMGRRPCWNKSELRADYTIDRIDNEKGYFPGNVRWADWSEQANNRDNPNGEEHLKAKLTLEQIREIRALHGILDQRTIADDYGLSQGYVSAIMRGEKRRGDCYVATGSNCLRPSQLGVENGQAWLTKIQVAEIKCLIEEGCLTQRQIAEIYDVTQTQVSRIKRGVNWGWVEPAKSVRTVVETEPLVRRF